MFTDKDYVSLETAKLLKEKGYDESTAGFYGSKRGLCIGSSLLYNTLNNRVNFVNNLLKVEFEDVIAAAPTLYEAQMWLLEKHNLFVEITAVALRGTDSPCGFSTNIFYGGESDWELCDCLNDVSSYQQSLDAGIQEALKMI